MSSEIGKWIIVAGLVFVCAGLLIYFLHDRLHWLGRLPGDIRIEKENFKFYFPFTTMLLLSLILTAGIAIIKWFEK